MQTAKGLISNEANIPTGVLAELIENADIIESK